MIQIDSDMKLRSKSY